MFRFRNFFIFAVLISLIVFSQYLAAEETDENHKISIIEQSYSGNQPLWLLMERGKQAYRLGEFGLASRLFREVLDRQKVYPDADLWLARVFIQEGEYLLAEKQYLRALENKFQLYIPEDEFTILYALAEIYRKTDQYGKYEQTLLEIIDIDQDDQDLLRLQYAMLDVLKLQGIDKMLELYRYTNNKYNKARLELGIFYYKTGRYTEAEINLLLPVISATATGFNYIYEKTASYEFSTIQNHISEMVEEPDLVEFLDKNRYYETLYYLAASLFADGFGSTAEVLWALVSTFDEESSIWRKRSERQLQSPFIEPIITHRS